MKDVYLLVVQGRPEGKRLLFPRCGEYLFGRGRECHIRPNSDWVSRQHCQLLVGLDQVRIRDLGSRNGTLVNGERVVGERSLNEGDQVQVGPLVFKICLRDPGDNPDAQPVSAHAKQGDTHSHCLDTKEMESLDPYQRGKEHETLDPDPPAQIVVQS